MLNRRGFVGALATASLAGTLGKKSPAKKAADMTPDLPDLDKAAAAPVLKLDKLKAPVIIESIKLLKKDDEYFVHVRSKDGAEGVALTNPPRELYLDKILKQLVIPFFTGTDARDLENLLWELTAGRTTTSFMVWPCGARRRGWSSRSWTCLGELRASQWGRCWETSCDGTWQSTWPAGGEILRRSRRSNTCKNW